MTKKELKVYLKTKASEIEVKDFSQTILERAKSLPRTHMESIEEPRRSLRLKPILTSFLLLTTTVFALFLFLGEEDIPPVIETPVLENMESVVALSAVQTTSLIHILETELAAETAIPLRFGPIERNNRIQDELNDVAKYLETIEKLYASNENFEVVDEAKSSNGFARRMRFRTKDLLEQEAQYEMMYNQTFNQATNRFQVAGQVKVGEKSYPFTVEGQKGERGIVMTAKKDDANFVILEYMEVDGVHYYTVELIKQDQSIQKVSIELTETEGIKQATLSFISGTSTGTYVFSIEVEDLKKIILIHYTIDFDGDIEEGDITIRILALPQSAIYSIIVKPEGRIPFSITRARFNTTQGMHPQLTII